MSTTWMPGWRARNGSNDVGLHLERGMADFDVEPGSFERQNLARAQGQVLVRSPGRDHRLDGDPAAPDPAHDLRLRGDAHRDAQDVRRGLRCNPAADYGCEEEQAGQGLHRRYVISIL